LPVPESPIRQHGCPAATQAPLARVVLPDAEDCDEGGVGDSDVGAL